MMGFGVGMSQPSVNVRPPALPSYAQVTRRHIPQPNFRVGRPGISQQHNLMINTDCRPVTHIPPPPISVQSQLPRFQPLYDQFDKMMQRRHVTETFLPGLAPPPSFVRQPPPPAACVYRGVRARQLTANDWSREARALLDELAALLDTPRVESSMWPGDDRTGEASLPCDDIHRHLLEMKSSTFAVSSPTRSANPSSSGVSCNGDSDDVASQTVTTSNAVTTHDNGGHVLASNYSSSISIDSGYFSAPTPAHDTLTAHGSHDGGDVERRLVHPTELPPHLMALLQTPWLQRASDTKWPSQSCAHRRPPPATAAGHFAPLARPATVHKHKEWITEDILEMIGVRDRLYKRMKRDPAREVVDLYKKVRNMVVGMTRNAKRLHEKRMEGGVPHLCVPSTESNPGLSTRFGG